MKKNSSVWGIVFIALIFVLLLSMCGGNSGHAPGYGNTGKCTICGKSATHHSSNYGFCGKHWTEAAGW